MKTNWFEKDGVVYFDIVLKYVTPNELIKDFKSKGIKISNDAQRILRSKKFDEVSGIETNCRVAVLKSRTEGIVYGMRMQEVKEVKIEERKLENLNFSSLEIALVILTTFSKEEAKKWGLSHIVIMHDSGYNYNMRTSECLCVIYENEYNPDMPPYIGTYYTDNDYGTSNDDGFAFIFDGK